MPLDFEVFRCNQFYFEDKYYLGRHIKATTLATSNATFSQVWTMLNLLTRGEYELDKVFLQDNHIWFGKDKENNEIYHTINKLSHYANLSNLVDRAYNGSFSHNIAEFLEWSNLASIYYAHHITSGILSCALAVAMGHREIYLAGIDFYDGNSHYFTNMRTPNIMRFTDLFVECDDESNYKSGMQWHKKVADIEALYFLQEVYGVKFYSLCESSPISKLIPLAKKTNSTFTPEPKPKDYIRDFCIPAKESFDFMQIPRFPIQESQKISEIQHLKRNIYFRLLQDLFKLPSHIKYYIKGKIAKEKAKKLRAEYENK